MAEANEALSTAILRREIDQALDARAQGAPLESGGNGGHTGGMDAWQTSVETRLAGFQSDFRWTWTGIAVSFLALGGGCSSRGI